MLMAVACSSEADSPEAPVENDGSYLRVTLGMPGLKSILTSRLLNQRMRSVI